MRNRSLLLVSLDLLAPAVAMADEPVQTIVVYVLGIGIGGDATVVQLGAAFSF